MSTFTVSNTLDSGSGSLRQAISKANTSSGFDIINFNSVFADNIADIITLGGSSLLITDDLSIKGMGADLLTVSGNNASRVFEISSGITVKIKGLTITNGYSTDEGGGIYNAGSLALSNSTVSDSQSTNYFISGGGIFNTSSGIMTIANSTISGNIGYISGGGIYNAGSLTLSNSTVSGNSHDSGGFGGGIFNEGIASITNSIINHNYAQYAGGIQNGGTLIVSNSTISDNWAYDDGGGIFTGDGSLTVNNSTISGNTAASGGGIAAFSGSIMGNSTITVNNSTISGNSADRGGGIKIITEPETSLDLTVSNSTITGNTASAPYGGGIEGGGSEYITVTLKNSIIAGNNSNSNPDIRSNFISNGFNLIGSFNGNTGFNANEKLNVPLTEIIDTTLRDNGGATKTHALVIGSRAINAGNNADIPADTTDLDGDGNTTEKIPFDQRGSGYNRISGGRVDIGAFEAVVNVINGTAGRDIIKGTAGNDIITGFQGRDILTGGEGADAFAYTSIRDVGDAIADFKIGTDKIVLRQLFQSFGLDNLNFATAIAGGYLRFKTLGSNTIVLIDPDGSNGQGRAVRFLSLNNVSATAANNSTNFAF